MPGRAIDRIEALLEPHAKAISILAAIWFWLSIAIYAGFVRLPQLPWLSDRALFWAGLAFNAAWWGFLRPAIEQRRKAVRAWSAIASAISSTSASGRSCPMPGKVLSRAPGMCAAVSRPPSTGTSGSASPWITRVGAAIRESRSRRQPSSTIAASWRGMPAG
jgi:hypothetical protein